MSYSIGDDYVAEFTRCPDCNEMIPLDECEQPVYPCESCGYNPWECTVCSAEFTVDHGDGLCDVCRERTE